MRNWKRWLIGASALLALALGANIVALAAGARDGTRVGGGVVDISGPCDEAEHANDPRCTGAGRVDDNSSPGRGHDREVNSGRSENSGPGNADDDDRGHDDNSGPGRGGDDHDNSGPGSDDD